MAKLINLLSAAFVCICAATVLTQVVGVVVLASLGYVTRDRIYRMAAVLYGIDLTGGAPDDKQHDADGQPVLSFEEANLQRSMRGLDLALREQAIEKGLAQTRTLRDQVREEKRRYELMRDAFRDKLDQLKNTAQEQGLVALRQSLEVMEPPLAKDQLLRMIKTDKDNGLQDAVAIVKSMPRELQAELYAQFRDDKDRQLLADMLAKILRGEPETTHVEEAQDRLNNFSAPLSERILQYS